MERRSFLKTLGTGIGAKTVSSIFDPTSVRRIKTATKPWSFQNPATVAADESYWREIQQAFTVSRRMINLNNGYCCPSPRIVTEAVVNYVWQQEEAPAYTLARLLPPFREPVRQGLARLFGCDTEEIALVRNASEAMEILLLGVELKSGDEVITTTQDYGRMRTALDQRRRREGIEVKLFTIPTPAERNEDIIANFQNAMTTNTKLILMSHQINLTGQILPVKEIASLAKERGIEVMVDGAHSFAQFAFKQPDINCDYFGTSLHKWLLAPKGTGLLYVKKEKIKTIWPLMAAPQKMDSDIRKFEEIGTHSEAPYLATSEAITFHNTIGSERKEARLRYLKDYWAEKLLEMKTVRLHTSLNPKMSCAIGNVELVGTDPSAMANYLWDKHKIIVVAINHDEFKGLRVTPNLYTTLGELDKFCEIFQHIAKRGLPKSA